MMTFFILILLLNVKVYYLPSTFLTYFVDFLSLNVVISKKYFDISLRKENYVHM